MSWENTACNKSEVAIGNDVEFRLLGSISAACTHPPGKVWFEKFSALL